MYRKKGRNLWLTVVMALILMLSMLPANGLKAEAAGEVLLETKVDVAANAANKDTYWNVEFKAGEVYTITAQWNAVPIFKTRSSVGTAWKLQTVPSDTVQSGGDLIFLGSVSSDSKVARGYTGVFIPTMDMSYLNLYYQNFGATANSITIKVEKGNTLGADIALGQKLVFDGYIDVAGDSKYVNAYFGMSFETGKTYTAIATHSSVPAYTDTGTGSAWKVTTVSGANTENTGENVLLVRRNAGETALQSQTAVFSPTKTTSVMNFFTQKCTSTDRTIRITIITPTETATVGEVEDVLTSGELYFMGANSTGLGITAGKTYKATIEWNETPILTGAKGYYKLRTASGLWADGVTGDIIVRTAKKSEAGTDKSPLKHEVIFTATKDAEALCLETAALNAANKVTISIEEVSSEYLLDANFDIPEGIGFYNGIFGVNFEKDKKYEVTATWNAMSSHSGVSTYWKYQATANETLEGNDETLFLGWIRQASGNQQSYTHTFTATSDVPYVNFFTQGVTAANSVHITVKEVTATDPEPTPNPYAVVGEETAVTAKTDSLIFKGIDGADLTIEAGKKYKAVIQWKNAPSLTGNAGYYKIQTISDASVTAPDGDIIVRAGKKDADGTDITPLKHEVIFTASKNAKALYLCTDSLTADNSVTVTIEEVTSDYLLDVTAEIPVGILFYNANFAMNYEVGKNYELKVNWSTVPEMSTESYEGRTAWKVQAISDESLVGTDTAVHSFTATTSGYKAAQTYTAIISDVGTAKPLTNFFLQFFGNTANSVRITVKETAETTPTVSYELDGVTVEQILSVAGSSGAVGDMPGGHAMQAFDIWNDIVFVAYDAGMIRTYDLNTGAFIAQFKQGVNAYVSSNHGGNADFGVEYPAGNTTYPALYVSGDLTTKSCYVLDVTENSSKQIQQIVFNLGNSYNGSQVVIDRENQRIIYMQREQSSIGLVNNRFMIYEFPLPKLSAGTADSNGVLTVTYTASDATAFYSTELWSPMYQGATVYSGTLFQTHGPTTNSEGYSVGLMAFGQSETTAANHHENLERYINLSSLIPNEPQGVCFYEDRLIMSFNGGKFYAISLDLIKTTGYDVASATDNADLISQLKALAEAELANSTSTVPDLKVDSVTLPSDFTVNGKKQTFTAEVKITNSYYNTQIVTISGTLTGDGTEPLPEVDKVTTAPTGTAVIYFTGKDGAALDIKAGHTYKFTVEWDTTPTLTGTNGYYKLSTVSGTTVTSPDGDIVVRMAKKNNNGSTATSVSSKKQEITFVATKDATALMLQTNGLSGVSTVEVNVEEVTVGTTTPLFEANLDIPAGTAFLNSVYTMSFEKGKAYAVKVEWATAPDFTGSSGSAWKIQATNNELLEGNGTYLYTATVSNNSAVQSNESVFVINEAQSLINFFLQRHGSKANSVHITVVETENPYPDYSGVTYESDKVTVELLFTGSSAYDSVTGSYHGMQGFDIYNDVVFIAYDRGMLGTYNLNTGELISFFRQDKDAFVSSNHGGNADFGVEFPEGNTTYPALYVSGDLTTKACYVLDVTETTAKLVQRINFNLNNTNNGSQVIIDHENNRIVYMQRKLHSYLELYNTFMIYEFDLPKLTDGTLRDDGVREITFTDADVKLAYTLEYSSPLYQGATIYNGRMLVTHGILANTYGEKVGLMNFGPGSVSGFDNYERHIDLTALVPYEPQGVCVYEDRLIMNFTGHGEFYEIKLDLGIQTDNYQIECATDTDNLIAKIKAAVTAAIAKAKEEGKTTLPDLAVKEVKLSEAAAASAEQTFTAEVVLSTAYYNNQTITVSGTVGEHSFTNYVSDGDATCTEDGHKTAQCDHTGCAATDTVDDVGSAKGHSMKPVEKVDTTCTEPGAAAHYYCETCKKTFSDADGKTEINDTAVPATGHKLTYVKQVDATIDAEGMKEHWLCENCGKYYSDAEGKTEVTKESLVIAKLTDSGDSTPGSGTGTDNSGSGDSGAGTGNSGSGDSGAETDNSGSGNTGAGTSAPSAVPDSTETAGTDTGDHNPIAWFCALMLLSAAAVIAVVVGRRKKTF